MRVPPLSEWGGYQLASGSGSLRFQAAGPARRWVHLIPAETGSPYPGANTYEDLIIGCCRPDGKLFCRCHDVLFAALMRTSRALYGKLAKSGIPERTVAVEKGLVVLLS